MQPCSGLSQPGQGLWPLVSTALYRLCRHSLFPRSSGVSIGIASAMLWQQWDGYRARALGEHFKRHANPVTNSGLLFQILLSSSTDSTS